MQVQVITGGNATDLQDGINEWLSELKAEVTPASELRTSVKEIDFVNIHKMFHIVQATQQVSNVMLPGGGPQVVHEICLFIFFTKK